MEVSTFVSENCGNINSRVRRLYGSSDDQLCVGGNVGCVGEIIVVYSDRAFRASSQHAKIGKAEHGPVR